MLVVYDILSCMIVRQTFLNLRQAFSWDSHSAAFGVLVFFVCLRNTPMMADEYRRNS